MLLPKPSFCAASSRTVVVEESESLFETPVAVVENNHQKNVTTLSRELAVVDQTFTYSFRLFAKTPSNEYPTADDAIEQVETDVFALLQKLVQASENRLQLQSVGNTNYQECDDSVDIPAGLTRCLDATTVIEIQLQDNMDPDVVRRSALSQIKTFVVDFNAKYPNQLQLEFEYPVFVDTTVKVSFLGLNAGMPQPEVNLFVDTFNKGMGPILKQQSDPAMELTDTTVVVNEVDTQLADASKDKRHRFLTSDQNTNQLVVLTLAIRATCATTRCVDTYLREFVVQNGNRNAETLEASLQVRAPSELSSLYFDPLSQIVFGQALVSSEELPPVLPTYTPQVKPAVPLWVWVVLGVDIGIWIFASIFTLLRARNRYQREKIYNYRSSLQMEPDLEGRLSQQDTPIAQSYSFESAQDGNVEVQPQASVRRSNRNRMPTTVYEVVQNNDGSLTKHITKTSYTSNGVKIVERSTEPL